MTDASALPDELCVYDADGTIRIPRDLDEWTAFMHSPAKIVVKDRVGDLLVSTAFLGIEHFGHMWFETMIFELVDGLHCPRYTGRYATLDEARAGHAAILEKVRSGELPE